MTVKLSAAFAIVALASLQAAQQPPAGSGQAEARFKASVDIVSVSATVTDASGRLVRGLTREDFRVYDNDVPQTITQFGSDPISLGILIDASNSMSGERIRAARSALE